MFSSEKPLNETSLSYKYQYFKIDLPISTLSQSCQVYNVSTHCPVVGNSQSQM